MSSLQRSKDPIQPGCCRKLPHSSIAVIPLDLRMDMYVPLHFVNCEMMRSFVVMDKMLCWKLEGHLTEGDLY
jgi:hypothetical protein